MTMLRVGTPLDQTYCTHFTYLLTLWDISAQGGSGRWVDGKLADFFRPVVSKRVGVYLY